MPPNRKQDLPTLGHELQGLRDYLYALRELYEADLYETQLEHVIEACLANDPAAPELYEKWSRADSDAATALQNTSAARHRELQQKHQIIPKENPPCLETLKRIEIERGFYQRHDN